MAGRPAVRAHAGCGVVPFADADDVVQAARSEGVLTLLAERLRARPAGDPLREAVVQAARGKTVVAMLREAECRRLLGLLDGAGIPVLLLKGSALAWWLYPAPHLRECSDVDLLFASREAVAQAAAVLAANGYDRGYTQGERAYELVCRRELSASFVLDVDLHWGLNNAPVFAHAFDFDSLWPTSIPLPALAPNARGLSPVHALAHACMHRAINLYTGIGDSLKWRYDLHLLAQRLQPAEWTELRAICERTGLGSVCAAGLQAAAEVFGDAAPAPAIIGVTRGRRRGRWRSRARLALHASDEPAGAADVRRAGGLAAAQIVSDAAAHARDVRQGKVDSRAMGCARAAAAAQGALKPFSGRRAAGPDPAPAASRPVRPRRARRASTPLRRAPMRSCAGRPRRRSHHCTASAWRRQVFAYRPRRPAIAASCARRCASAAASGATGASTPSSSRPSSRCVRRSPKPRSDRSTSGSSTASASRRTRSPAVSARQRATRPASFNVDQSRVGELAEQDQQVRFQLARGRHRIRRPARRRRIAPRDRPRAAAIPACRRRRARSIARSPGPAVPIRRRSAAGAPARTAGRGMLA